MRKATTAFTLIETMAVVTVVAVLLAITLPALRNARVTVDSTVCLVSLSSIAKMQASYAAANNGRWPNDFERDTQPQYYLFNNVPWVVISTIAQSRVWPGPLRAKGYYDEDEPTQGVSCPVVHRAWRDYQLDHRSNQDQSPTRSYHYSAAMFTESKLWDPADPLAERARLEEFGPDRFRKSVGVEEVKFPSYKVVMSERVDNHGRGARFGDPSLGDDEKAVAKANVSFADGHVERVEPYRAQEPLVVNWTDAADGLSNFAIPFNAAAWGYRGRDY